MPTIKIPRLATCKICEKRFVNEVKKSGISLVTCRSCRQAMIDDARAKKKKNRRKSKAKR